MLENSYDAKGMKFGLVVVDNPEKLKAEFENKYCEMIFNEKDKRNPLGYYGPVWFITENKHYSIIPFEDVDGLSVDDVDELVGENSIDGNLIFLMYNEINFTKEDRTVVNKRQPIYAIIINVNNLKKTTIPIEDVIDDKITSILNDQKCILSEVEKKYFKCFLQRYKYGNVEKVNEHVLSKMINK